MQKSDTVIHNPLTACSTLLVTSDCVYMQCAENVISVFFHVASVSMERMG